MTDVNFDGDCVWCSDLWGSQYDDGDGDDEDEDDISIFAISNMQRNAINAGLVLEQHTSQRWNAAKHSDTLLDEMPLRWNATYIRSTLNIFSMLLNIKCHT